MELALLPPPPLASQGVCPKDVGEGVFLEINLWVAVFVAKNKFKTINEVVTLSTICISGSQSFVMINNQPRCG